MFNYAVKYALRNGKYATSATKFEKYEKTVYAYENHTIVLGTLKKPPKLTDRTRKRLPKRL